MLSSRCYTASYHIPNRNHLKEKMISIIVEIPWFFFLRFLCIRFFFRDMGFLPISLVLFKIRTIYFYNVQVPRHIASSTFLLLLGGPKLTESSFLPGHGCKGLIPSLDPVTALTFNLVSSIYIETLNRGMV